MSNTLILMAENISPTLPASLNLPAPTMVRRNSLRFAVDESFRLPENILAALTDMRIDHAILPDRAFSELGMVISDMDSTFITIECVDEIAGRLGLKDKVAAITERSMRGEIDFTQSLRERVRLLRGLPESELQTVYDRLLRLSPGAESLVAHCHRHGIEFALVSGGFTFFTDRLKSRLGLYQTHANVLEIADGKLTGEVRGRIIDSAAKRDILCAARRDPALRGRLIMAVGDGANDIPMLREADVGVAWHAKPKTRAAADAVIDFGGLDMLAELFRDDAIESPRP